MDRFKKAPENEGGEDPLLQTEDYAQITRKSKMLITIEVGLAALLSLLVWLHLKAPLWDQFYLEQVLADWKRGPIVQLRTIPADGTCDADSMRFTGELEKFNTAYGDSQDQFEIVGQGYFWGLRAGCVCQKGQYLQYDTRRCRAEMRRNGICKDIT